MSNGDPDRLSKPIFHTYQQLRDDLDALRSLDRVAVVDRTVTQIGKSPDSNWTIPAIKIGKNPAHRSFICGNDHAREWISVEVPYLLAELLVKVANDIKVHAQFDRHKTQIKQLLKEREVWIVPMLNPEGNTYTRVPGRELWRKNRRFLDYEQYTTVDGDTLKLLAEFFGLDSEKHMAELARRKKGTGDRGVTDWQELARHNVQELAQRKVSVTDPTLPLPAGIPLKIPIFGVDLNRNYPFKWNSQKVEVKEASAKRDYGFPGTEAASEYEVQSVMKLFTQAADDKNPFQSALSYHNFGEVVLYPWGYDKKATDRSAVVDFAGYMASLINQARNPAALAEIKRAREEFIKEKGIKETDANFTEDWSRDKRRQFYLAANPGVFSFGGEGGSFLDWVHDKFDGMPVYTIELSPNLSAGARTTHLPETDILPIFRENLPAALALIEYQNFQRQARKRGSAYRCHFFSYAGPQTKGVLSQWTQHLQPFGDRVALTGEVVELFTTINPDVYPITDQARVRFDILEQDHFLTGGFDDAIGSLLGTGAKPKDGLKPQNKTTVFQKLEGGQTLQGFVEKFKQTQSAYQDNILIVEEPQNGKNRHHLLTWWTAQRLEDYLNSEFYFIVNVNDAFEDQSEEILDVSSTAIPTGNTVEDKVRAALILVNEQLGTGITDWAVTDTEATRVQQILSHLEPEVLIRTVQRMRLGDAWKTFKSNLPDSAQPVDFELSILPSTGYLMPGDQIRVTVTIASVGGRISDDPPLKAEARIDEKGVRLPQLPQPVKLIGVLPKDAPDVIGNAYVDQLILRNPIVKVEVIERGPLYANLGTFSPIEFQSSPRARDTSEQGKRIAKQEMFSSYISSATGRDPFVLNALTYYHKWLGENYNSPEFLTREPHELWEWALQQASIPPPRPPIAPYLEISRRMLARVEESPLDEKRRILDALDWFHAWLDRHRTDEELKQHDAEDIWLQAWRKAIQADIKRIEEEVRRKVLADREEAELKAHFAAADEKLKRTMELIVTKILPTKEPEVIDAPSEGVSYLIMASENERLVREIIAEGFLHYMVERMSQPDPKFRETTADQDLLTFLKENPDLLDALNIAYAHPYVEKHDLERDIPGWQTAISVAIGFIPVVGQIVGAYEAISGEDIFGNPLTGTERAIIGACILLPAASKIYKVSKAAVTSGEIARTYRLTARESDALFRATAEIKPGSIGEKLLGSAKADILAGKKIVDQQRMDDLAALLKEMGMLDDATARVLSFARRTTRPVTRRIDRLELSKFVSKLTPDELAHLQTLGEDAWSRLFTYATSRTSAFGKGGAARSGAIFSLKGKIAEELFTLTKEFDDMHKAVLEIARKEGIPADSVKFITNVVSDMPKGSPFPTGELTDGVFVAFHNNKARVLGVIESKSPTNLKDLAAARGEYFGQIEKDFERFSEFTVYFEGRAFSEADIVISRHNTLWIGVGPPGFQLGPTHMGRIQNGIPGFRLVNGLVDDARLNEVAERLLQLLSTP